MNLRYVLPLVLLILSCKGEKKQADTLFTLLDPEVTGIGFKNQLTETEQFNIIEYLYFNNGAGVAAGDINNDGLTDLYFTANQVENRLYLNKGGLKFEDITEKAGVQGSGNWKTGVTMADVNGDGLTDIYVCGVDGYKGLKGGNQLFINRGDLTFTDEATEYGLDFRGFATQSAFFDYDLDGDLDMYLVTHSVHSSRTYGRMDLRFMDDPKAGDRLFRNDQVNGKCIFKDVTREAGIFSSQIGYGLGVSICDINNDGFPDIYVSNDFHENDYLYINNRDATFTESLTRCMPHTSRSSMGNDAADFNNDGLIDILVLDMLPDDRKTRQQSGGEDDYELSMIKKQYGYNEQFVRNTLQLNLGGCLFSEIGQLAGISATDWSWSPLFCDLDNDGWKDIFITSGIYHRANDLDYIRFLTTGVTPGSAIGVEGRSDKELYDQMPLYPNINYTFRNNANLTFSNVSEEWGFTDKAFSNGSAFADLDNDGDLDLVVNNINSEATVYRNNSRGKGNHFLSVKLAGAGMNSKGTGSRVTLYSNGKQQIAEQYTTRGFMSASSDIIHFGLGNLSTIDSLCIRWPDLSEMTVPVSRVDTMVLLSFSRQPGKSSSPGHPEQYSATSHPELSSSFSHPERSRRERSRRVFTLRTVPGLDFIHKEDNWSDLSREKLLPHALSSEGPALAAADVNGDGLTDLFTGGAKGQQSLLYLQRTDGSFKPLMIKALEQENQTDCIDAVFLDIDADNDPDLYVVKGGNELPAGDSGLYDLLLVNNGKGDFTKSENFPRISHHGSCIEVADYDNDGDADLFTGSRSIPGAYGLSPRQFLLENDGKGRFIDITDSRAKELKNIGMVSGATWLDYDKDGDPDLAVSGEWMKVTLFRNDNGLFTNVTSLAGLDSTAGWWYCLESADVDLDGDADLVGGNLGTNTILKASVKEPVELYLGDFDNSGSLDQVIATNHLGKSYPVAQLDELSAWIKGLDKQFASYRDFAEKSMGEIFGSEAMKRTFRKNAVMMESTVFLNNGNGEFSAHLLPLETQFSVVRDVMVGDYDHDGRNDMIICGNNYPVRPTYGRYDASYGWLLRGTNEGYTALWPPVSGLSISGDSRRMEIIDIKGKKHLVVAVNSGALQVYELK